MKNVPLKDDVTAPLLSEPKDVARLLSMRWNYRYQYPEMLNLR
jgi:hypothetical protein